MKRWLLPLMLSFLSCTVQAQAIRIEDDRGREVLLPAPPQRVVSILPSLTETVCELGQCHRLVGVDRYSSSPASVRKLPQVGGGVDPNVEAIVALRPDVVLAATSSRAMERLESLGLKVVALEPRTHADVRRVMLQVSQLLGVPVGEAVRLWHLIDESVSAAAQTVPIHARGARVYFEVNGAPYAAGESSFIGETLVRLGARNIVPPALGPFPKLNPEYVVRANPEVIMVGDRHFGGLTGRPGWTHIQAVREQRVCLFGPEESDIIVRPGPRMAEGARLLARCLAETALPAGPRVAQ